MGHFIFCFLHLLALVFGIVGLFITIPLHLIYCAITAPDTTIKEVVKKEPETN